MTRSRWIIFAAICVIILGGLVIFSKKDTMDVSNMDLSKVVSETETAIGDHVYGDVSSQVVLIEYGDFQCPGCAGAYPQLQSIKEEYKDQIAFIYRHFPLTTIHPNALAASTAAEAAGLQGKFWEMHDTLFENQNSWKDADTSQRTDVFAGYAEDLGLDVDKFRNDLSDPRISSKISRDRALGGKLNITGTPTVYINDQKLGDGEVTDLTQGTGDQLRDKLDAALKAVGVEPPKRS